MWSCDPTPSHSFLPISDNVRTAWSGKGRSEEIPAALTQLEELGEEFQHPVTELGREVLVGRRHHDLHQFSTAQRGELNQLVKSSPFPFSTGSTCLCPHVSDWHGFVLTLLSSQTTEIAFSQTANPAQTKTHEWLLSSISGVSTYWVTKGPELVSKPKVKIFLPISPFRTNNVQPSGCFHSELLNKWREKPGNGQLSDGESLSSPSPHTQNTVGVLGCFYHSSSRLWPAQFVFMIWSQANPPPPPLKLSTCSPTEALREFGILQLGL